MKRNRKIARFPFMSLGVGQGFEVTDLTDFRSAAVVMSSLNGQLTDRKFQSHRNHVGKWTFWRIQ